jgi:hypothetical protein
MRTLATVIALMLVATSVRAQDVGQSATTAARECSDYFLTEYSMVTLDPANVIAAGAYRKCADKWKYAVELAVKRAVSEKLDVSASTAQSAFSETFKSEYIDYATTKIMDMRVALYKANHKPKDGN